MIESRFRHRAKSTETILERHAKVVLCLRSIPWLWDCNRIDAKLSSQGESAACDLTGYLKNGIRGAISYSARFKDMQDKAMFDDVLTIQLDEEVVPCREFASTVFEQIVSCFNSYRASIVHDLDLDLDDYDQIVELARTSGQDIDGRDSIYRINPVNFFDDELCKRSFDLGAIEVASRLKGRIEHVAIQNGGVLVVVTGDLVEGDNVKGVHNHIAELLGMPTSR